MEINLFCQKTQDQLPKTMTNSHAHTRVPSDLDIQLCNIDHLVWLSAVLFWSYRYGCLCKGVIRYGYISNGNVKYYGILFEVNNRDVTEVVPYNYISDIITPSTVPNAPYLGQLTTNNDGKMAFVQKFEEDNVLEGVKIIITFIMKIH